MFEPFAHAKLNYVLVLQYKTFNDAEIYCKDVYKTNLASIHSPDNQIEAELMCREKVGDFCWLGLKRNESDSTFSWTDGTSLDQTFYGNAMAANEHCVHLNYADQFLWATQPCTVKYRFMCNAPPNRNYSDYYSSDLEYSSSGRYLRSKSMSVDWFEARWICRNIFDGDLASNIDSNKDAEIKALNAGSNWIGAFVPGGAHAYWSNGSPYSYTGVSGYNGWYPGIPNSFVEQCARNGLSGKWDDIRCSTALTFICQITAPSASAVSEVPNVPVSKQGLGYIVGTTRMNFDAAEQYCKTKYGTNLASVHSQEDAMETEILCKGTINDFCWIGMSRTCSAATCAWRWKDGTVVDYTHFDLPIAGYQCIYLYSVKFFRWVAHACTQLYYPICNAPANSTYTDHYNATYSYFQNYVTMDSIIKGLDWFESRFLCQKYFGQDLATIGSRHLDYEAAQLCWQKDKTTRNCWMGAFNPVTTHSVWAEDGSQVVQQTNSAIYSNFADVDGFPKDSVKKCIEINSVNKFENKWDNEYCYTRMNFICNAKSNNKLQKYSPKCPASANSAASSYISKKGFLSYILSTEKKTFADAEKYCQNTYGTKLAKIRNKVEEMEAELLCKGRITGNCWIGMQRGSEAHLWKWRDGSTVGCPDSFSNFGTAIKPAEHCIILWNGMFYTWNTSPCITLNYFLCNAPANTRYEDHYRYSYSSDGNYITTTMKMEYFDGSFMCQKLFGTNMAYIPNADFNKDALDLCDYEQNTANGRCWIGAFNPFFKHIFWLKNNDYVTANDHAYTDWYPNMPDNGAEFCVEGGYKQAWNDNSCEAGFPVICDASCTNPNNKKISITPNVGLNSLAKPGQMSYIVSTSLKNWADAEQHCITIYGTNLASIHSEEDAIESELLCKGLGNGYYCWIGLYRLIGTSLTDWRWSDGSILDYNVYGKYIFNNYNYMHLHVGDVYRWGSNPPTSAFYPICNAPVDASGRSNVTFQKAFPQYLKISKTSVYKAVKLKMTYYAAEFLCGKLFNTHLATIPSAADNADAIGACDALTGNTGNKCWVGALNAINRLIVWYGVEFGSNDYTKWYKGQPSSYAEKCVETGMGADQWNDLPCETASYFICGTNIPTTVVPTTKPTTKAPTSKPTTKAPTTKPTTKAPTAKPTKAPAPAPTVEPCTTNTVYHVQFVLDESGSVSKNNWDTVIVPFVTDAILKDINAESLIDVIGFASDVDIIYSFTDDQTSRTQIITALKIEEYDSGWTETYLAVNTGIKRFVDQGYTNVGDANIMFLFTDGEPMNATYNAKNPCGDTTLKNKLNINNIKVIIIKIGTFSDDQISCLVKDKSTDIITVASFSAFDFNSVHAKLRKNTCIIPMALIDPEVADEAESENENYFDDATEYEMENEMLDYEYDMMLNGNIFNGMQDEIEENYIE